MLHVADAILCKKMLYYASWGCIMSVDSTSDAASKGDSTSRSRNNKDKYLMYRKKIISYHIRKSAISQVLQYQFQRRKNSRSLSM